MVVSLEQFGIDCLPVEERLELLGLIWDSLDQEQVSAPIPEWHRKELEKRIADADVNPDTGIPWEEVRSKTLCS